MLFYGPTGAGKKTLIMCTLRELFGPSVEKVCPSQGLLVPPPTCPALLSPGPGPGLGPGPGPNPTHARAGARPSPPTHPSTRTRAHAPATALALALAPAAALAVALALADSLSPVSLSPRRIPRSPTSPPSLRPALLHRCPPCPATGPRHAGRHHWCAFLSARPLTTVVDSCSAFAAPVEGGDTALEDRGEFVCRRR